MTEALKQVIFFFLKIYLKYDLLNNYFIHLLYIFVTTISYNK